jgi:peptide-methionine (S)-S-oxide reductase
MGQNSTIFKLKGCPQMAKAMFGAGCFWGVEAEFRQLDGVTHTAVGYAGGTVDNPTYKQVCTGTTRHTEVVYLEFDPEKVSYEKLLEVFWSSHNPTTLNRQGPDIGTQYRSAIFYYGNEQRDAAEQSKQAKSKDLANPIVTQIEAAGEFYMAEDYHQQYFEKQGISHCPTH